LAQPQTLQRRSRSGDGGEGKTIELSLLERGPFDSEAELPEQVLCLVRAYKETAKPLAGTYTGEVLNA
jgi:hypothetical protein